MSRKSKVVPAIKVKLVERYLRNDIGMSEAARLAGRSGLCRRKLHRLL